MKNLKVGHRFCPEDEQLIGFYLYRRMKEALSPEERSFIGDCDMYGDEEPNQIWDMLGDEEEEEEEGILVFSKLKRAKKEDGSDGVRFERKVGTHGGNWHGEDAGSEIAVTIRSPDGSHKKRLVGRKKRFIYKHKGSEQDGVWILQEYTLENSDWALCRLKKSPHAAKKSANKRPASSRNFNMENHAKKIRKENTYGDGSRQEPVVYPFQQQNQQMIMQQPTCTNGSFNLPQLVEEDENNNNAVETSNAEMIYPPDVSTSYQQMMQHGFGYGNINPPDQQPTNGHSSLGTLPNVCSALEPENQLMQQQQSMCITGSLFPSWLVEKDRDNGRVVTPFTGMTCLDDSTSDEQIQQPMLVNEENFSSYNQKIQQPMHEVICLDDSTSDHKQQIQQPIHVNLSDTMERSGEVDWDSFIIGGSVLSYEHPWTVEEVLEEVKKLFSTDDDCCDG